jgi:hypothetical protein
VDPKPRLICGALVFTEDYHSISSASDEAVFYIIVISLSRICNIEYPDLPGCLSCADNEEEAFKMAKEALQLHLYGMEQD